LARAARAKKEAKGSCKENRIVIAGNQLQIGSNNYLTQRDKQQAKELEAKAYVKLMEQQEKCLDEEEEEFRRYINSVKQETWAQASPSIQKLIEKQVQRKPKTIPTRGVNTYHRLGFVGDSVGTDMELQGTPVSLHSKQ
jgi:mRNA degradation ribonuclease J1/J2